MESLSNTLPLVSIIVPVFNGEKYLRESLDSILNQTYPNIEILVMDDASTDSTPQIIASYGDRVKCVRQAQNKGIYANANDGIALAEGKYIAVYHSDDIYDPRIVEREVRYLEENSRVGAVFCKDIFVDGDNLEYGRLQLQREVSGERPLEYPVVLNALLEYKNAMFVCPAAMVRASVYEDVGVYRQEQFFNTSDLEMWLRIARKYPLAIIDDYLLRYRHSDEQSSRRYHKLRTAPGRFFSIMDLYLEADGKRHAAPKALAAYEGHRAEDFLMTAVNQYILGDLQGAASTVRRVRAKSILGGHHIERTKMTVLFSMLVLLVRLPRIGVLANAFYYRWQVRDKHKKTFKWSALFDGYRQTDVRA